MSPHAATYCERDEATQRVSDCGLVGVASLWLPTTGCAICLRCREAAARSLITSLVID